MTRDEAFDLTEKSRKENFENAKRKIYDTIKMAAEKGEYRRGFNINIWFENVDYCDFKEFTKELKSNGFNIDLDSELLEISWK